MNHFEKFNKANRIFFVAENARFFEYYMCNLALKIGESLIWDALYISVNTKLNYN